MTLIIGIKCSDGIVIGADGAATFATMGQPTIRQEMTKLDQLCGRMIVGVAGPVGLAQRIKSELDVMWSDSRVQLASKRPAEAMQVIRATLWQKHIAGEYEAAKVASGLVGMQVASASALSSTMIAVPLASGQGHQSYPALLSLDEQGSPQESTERMPFVSIGSGQAIADPFLAFVRRLFWPTACPTLNEGTFAVVWTLRHAILTNAGGISEPIQVMRLENQGKGKTFDWRPRQLAADELEEHLGSIASLEAELVRIRTVGQSELASAPQAPKV